MHMMRHGVAKSSSPGKNNMWFYLTLLILFGFILQQILKYFSNKEKLAMKELKLKQRLKKQKEKEKQKEIEVKQLNSAKKSNIAPPKENNS